MGNKKSTSDLVLHEWFIDLNKNPLIISRFDSVELSELHIYIDVIRQGLFNKVMGVLDLNPQFTNEWGYNNVSSYACTLNRFEYLLKMIKEQFEILNTSDKTPPPARRPRNNKKGSFNNKIFKSESSEELFYYILENCEFKINLKNIGSFFFWFRLTHFNCYKYEYCDFWNELDYVFEIPPRENNIRGINIVENTKINKELDKLLELFDNKKLAQE